MQCKKYTRDIYQRNCTTLILQDKTFDRKFALENDPRIIIIIIILFVLLISYPRNLSFISCNSFSHNASARGTPLPSFSAFQAAAEAVDISLAMRDGDIDFGKTEVELRRDGQ
uniref:Uncharacterized protein n=1 Tax=Kalanchoe fedtschenkoi TaxID=63787 RepID=A0A7N0VGI5_KALFE